MLSICLINSRKYKRNKSRYWVDKGLIRKRKFDVMASVRQNKASRLIQKELSIIFQKESNTLFKGVMTSVTVVRMSPDLKVAKIYLSFFGVKNMDESLDHVNKIKGNIRRILGMSMKHQLRYIPELNFFLDDSLDYADEISDLLNKDE